MDKGLHRVTLCVTPQLPGQDFFPSFPFNFILLYLGGGQVGLEGMKRKTQRINKKKAKKKRWRRKRRRMALVHVIGIRKWQFSRRHQDRGGRRWVTAQAESVLETQESISGPWHLSAAHKGPQHLLRNVYTCCKAIPAKWGSTYLWSQQLGDRGRRIPTCLRPARARF